MKTVLITGASGGIGKAAAEKFAANGYFVGVCYNVNKAAAETLAEKIHGVAIRMNVTDYSSVSQAFDAFLQRAGKLDVLVNSAGVALPVKTLLDTSEDEFDRVFSVNVKGTYNAIKRALPCLLEHVGRRGRLVRGDLLRVESGGHRAYQGSCKRIRRLGGDG